MSTPSIPWTQRLTELTNIWTEFAAAQGQDQKDGLRAQLLPKTTELVSSLENMTRTPLLQVMLEAAKTCSAALKTLNQTARVGRFIMMISQDLTPLLPGEATGAVSEAAHSVDQAFSTLFAVSGLVLKPSEPSGAAVQK